MAMGSSLLAWHLSSRGISAQTAAQVRTPHSHSGPRLADRSPLQSEPVSVSCDQPCRDMNPGRHMRSLWHHHPAELKRPHVIRAALWPRGPIEIRIKQAQGHPFVDRLAPALKAEVRRPDIDKQRIDAKKVMVLDRAHTLINKISPAVVIADVVPQNRPHRCGNHQDPHTVGCAIDRVVVNLVIAATDTYSARRQRA